MCRLPIEPPTVAHVWRIVTDWSTQPMGQVLNYAADRFLLVSVLVGIKMCGIISSEAAKCSQLPLDFLSHSSCTFGRYDLI